MIIIIIFLMYMITYSPYLYADKHKNFTVFITEDLMREHGILNRILLIYEEIIKKIDTHKQFPLNTLTDAVDIIKSFIENHHEKLEENYVFPVFEKHKKELPLIKTLKNQHAKGRKITNKLQNLLLCKTTLDNKTKKRIKSLLKKFIRMYRPHEAREDTVLFPQLYSLISKDKLAEISKKAEQQEDQLFGKNGFENILKKIETIEQKLGIYDLEQFTAKYKNKDQQ